MESALNLRAIFGHAARWTRYLCHAAQKLSEVLGARHRGNITERLDTLDDANTVIAQHDLSAALLVDGYEFDRRVCVILLSCSPLSACLSTDLLARFCRLHRMPTCWQ